MNKQINLIAFLSYLRYRKSAAGGLWPDCHPFIYFLYFYLILFIYFHLFFLIQRSICTDRRNDLPIIPIGEEFRFCPAGISRSLIAAYIPILVQSFLKIIQVQPMHEAIDRPLSSSRFSFTHSISRNILFSYNFSFFLSFYFPRTKRR